MPDEPASSAPSDHEAPTVRWRLKPALRRMWRDGETLQLGVDPQRAVVVGGLDTASAQLLERLDGTRDHDVLVEDARRLGVSPARLAELVAVFDRVGALDDALAERRGLDLLPLADRERLAPDRAAASVVHGGRDGGAGVLARRRSTVALVHGAGRIGSTVVTLLAAAGVGTVVAADQAVLRGRDVAPGGAELSDVGSRRQDAALRAARRVAPGLRARLPASTDRPDVAVVTPEAAAVDQIAAGLARQGVPHLLARVRDGTGIVGPFVLPSRSSCLRCHDLHRSDRDPAWPALAAQLAAQAPADVPCDVSVATLVAAQAVLQVLALVDRPDGPPPSTVDGTLEIAPLDGRTRRRRWSVHPLCGCDWQPG